jgi:hypothetical protein
MTYVNKKAILKFVVIIILGVVVASASMSAGVLADAPTESEYSDILNNTYGEGTISNPYFVTTVDELQAVQGDLTAEYILGKNIDASETETWNSGAGFTPLGNYTDPFSGNFDGQGHSVDGLYINRPNTFNIGLFGSVNSADIKNIGVTNLDIQGDNNVGGLVGFTEGARIMTSYSSGSVGGNEAVGGLVGHIHSYTNITNSYSIGAVSGDIEVGGLVGHIHSDTNITNSYSTGEVSGNGAVGGLVGYTNNGKVTDSFWDTETSNQATSAGSATGLTTSEITGLAAMNMVGFDFASEWKTVSADDYDSSADSYPILYSVDIQTQLVSADVYEATYTVNVIVEDSDGNAISGTDVELDGKSSGYFVDGTYTLSVSADGYDTLNKDLTIDGADKTVTVTLLEESTYSVDVIVEDSDGNAISGANVEIDGTDGAIQYLTDGQYNITASADGYDTLSQDITVDGAAETVTVTLSDSNTDDSTTDDSTEEEEDVIYSVSSSEESGGMSTLVSASVVAFFGIFIMVVLLFGKD